MQLAIDKVDSINYGTNWLAGRPTLKDGQFFHVLSSGAQKLLLKNSVRNTNPILPLDVNADGHVSPRDALAVLSFLNSTKRSDWHASDGPMSSEQLASFLYYDVSADGYVSPRDLLLIINLLNGRARSAEGEFVGDSERGDDLLIGVSTETQDDLATLDNALADWDSGDWALTYFDLGDIIDDDDKDDLWGEE